MRCRIQNDFINRLERPSPALTWRRFLLDIFRSESLSLIDARKLSAVRNIRRNVSDEGTRAPRCCLPGEHGDPAGRGGFSPAKAVRISDRELADAAVDTSAGVQGDGDSESQPHEWRGSAEGLASVEEAVEALKNGQVGRQASKTFAAVIDTADLTC